VGYGIGFSPRFRQGGTILRGANDGWHVGMATVLEVSNLNFRYASENALRGISFQIAEGEPVGIVGANGSGKSTLLWCIAGLLHGEGRVRLFGGQPPNESRKRIGMVFQNPEDQLFMPTLAQDLALPLVNHGMRSNDAQKAAHEWLDRFGLSRHAGLPATHLSLGQRKRAAVALAMIRSPELLIMDEPTAELDGRAVRQLAVMLNQLGVTKLIASHHLDFLRATTSRVILLHEGALRSQGPTADILNDTALLEESGLL
jgi:cobalt/nickel transport system ATP-binding protein